MITIYIVNFCLIFPAVLTVIYHCPDLPAALADSTTYPAIYVLRQSMSVPWITVILVIICLLNVASNIVYLAAVTRDLFAFARDQGLPFSKWLSTVSERRRIPVNACILSCGFAVLLSMIYIGSITAFYAITSLSTLSLLQCYSLSIGCVLYRRIRRPETLPPASFSLGRLGIPINSMAVAFCKTLHSL
jgi:choline transport protein